MYIILVNNGVYEGGKVFADLDEVSSLLMEWSEGEELMDFNDDDVTVDDLLDAGACGETVDIYNDNMVERGDMYVSLSVVELQM